MRWSVTDMSSMGVEVMPLTFYVVSSFAPELCVALEIMQRKNDLLTVFHCTESVPWHFIHPAQLRISCQVFEQPQSHLKKLTGF
jgi:hypothetical protein